MDGATRKILQDAKMLSRVMQLENQKSELTFSEKAELKDYLEELLKREEHKRENALSLYQKRQMQQNIKSQIDGLKHYEVATK